MPKFVTIEHPELDQTAQVAESSFENVWSALGWELVEGTETTVYSTTPSLVSEQGDEDVDEVPDEEGDEG